MDNQNEDYILDDNVSNQNYENMDMDDNNTLPTHEVNFATGNGVNVDVGLENDALFGNASLAENGKVANSNSLIIYAPISSI